MTTLIFVRHGQSESNLKQIFTGQSNVPLTPLGERQAQNTAHFLNERNIDVIYSSDLLRSMQTAIPTARMKKLDIIPDEGLREIFAGDWEGRSYESLASEDAEAFERWRIDCGNSCPTGGESVKSLARRIYNEVERILKKERGKCVAIFTHATPIRLMRAKWEGIDIDDLSNLPFCGNASVSVVDYDDDGSFTVRLCCYDEHQGKDATTLPRGNV